MPVSLSTVHHEGSGSPHDDPGVAGTKGYSVWIGPTRYTLLRPPTESFATLHYNHVSFDVCFSGDRGAHPLTAFELALLRVAAAEARNRGWIIDAPYERPHRESPGSATICPSNNVAYPDPPTFPAGDALTWVAVVTALHKETPPMPPALAPEFFPALSIVSECRFNDHGVIVTAMLDASGAVFCDPPEHYKGGANGKSYFAGRTAARIDAEGAGYIIRATTDEPYHYPEH